MSIEQTKILDAVGVDSQSGDLVLTISDHLDWQASPDEHLLLLQEKINAYLSFIESGELLKTYPNAKGRNVVVQVIYKFAPNERALEFYAHATEVLSGAGLMLKHGFLEHQ